MCLDVGGAAFIKEIYIIKGKCTVHTFYMNRCYNIWVFWIFVSVLRYIIKHRW